VSAGLWPAIRVARSVFTVPFLSVIPLFTIPQESIIMRISRFAMRPMFPAVLLTALATSPGHAEDDVVVDDKPEAAAQVVPFQGENLVGNVIIMPGLRLQVQALGDGGNVQVGGVQVEGQGPAADIPMRKLPYLGVVAKPVSAAVRAQLDLPEGVGVSVDAVAAGSPAEKAGLKPFDVIHMFKDQLIVSNDQLTTLINAAGAGTKVPLKVFRGGRKREVEAVLGEHEAPADVAKIFGRDNKLMQELVAGGLDREALDGVELQIQEALKQAQANMVVVRGGRAMVQSRVVAGGQSSMTVSDKRGTVEIHRTGEKQTVTIKDPAGKEVHAGPLDTAEDFAKVPEAYREWVRELAPHEAELEADK
jgi:hypothetical protein